MKYGVSACLLGFNCKYSGGHNRNGQLMDFLKDKVYVPVCPEVLGGLPTPRACCEIVCDKVMNTVQEDCTKQFHLGAQHAIDLLKREDVDIVVLQSRSPSCGVSEIYDGTFTGVLKKGNGIFVERLQKEKMLAMDVHDFLKKYASKE